MARATVSAAVPRMRPATPAALFRLLRKAPKMTAASPNTNAEIMKINPAAEKKKENMETADTAATSPNTSDKMLATSVSDACSSV